MATTTAPADDIQPITSILSMQSFEKINSQKGWSPFRRRMAQIVESRFYDVIMGVLILLNSVVIILETDHRASGAEEATWMSDVGTVFLVIYIIDLVIRFWIYRRGFFDNRYNLLDALVVAADLTGTLISLVTDGPAVSIFRLLRICRLLRFVHILFLFRELHLMLTGFVSAMKAIFWASFMLAIMITLWSIIAVEVLHPINARLTARGVYDGCERCSRAFSSVSHSNLTFLQQIIAGDSWGQVSVPIIEEEPATVFLFFAVLVTINLGLLNLVLTVIVDAAAEAREADESRRLIEKGHDFEQAKEKLMKICAELDEDESGELTFGELMAGMENNPNFAKTMTLMDVSKEDMSIIYNMLDEDHSGTVTYKEFVEQLHKMKSQDTHTMLIFIKGYLNDVRQKMSEQLTIMKDDLGGTTRQLLSAMHGLLYGEDQQQEEQPALPLKVMVEQAKGLRNADWVGTSDPYCVCEIMGKPEFKFQTPVINNSLEPIWNFEAKLEGFVRGDSLLFTLWDKDTCKADDLLGKAVLPAETLKNRSIFHGTLNVEVEGRDGGQLKVKIVDPSAKERPTQWQAALGKGKDEIKKFTSLCGIAEDLQKLGSRMDTDFAQVLQEVSAKSKWPSQMPAAGMIPGPVIPPSPLQSEANPWQRGKQAKSNQFDNSSPCCNVNRASESKQITQAAPRA